nr:uncharacterized protein LOC124213270 [Neodiprion pinetum]
MSFASARITESLIANWMQESRTVFQGDRNRGYHPDHTSQKTDSEDFHCRRTCAKKKLQVFNCRYCGKNYAYHVTRMAEHLKRSYVSCPLSVKNVLKNKNSPNSKKKRKKRRKSQSSSSSKKNSSITNCSSESNADVKSVTNISDKTEISCKSGTRASSTSDF